MVQLALPWDAEPIAASSPPGAITVPIPQPQRPLCPPRPSAAVAERGGGAGGTQGRQPDGWMDPFPAAAPPTPPPTPGSQPKNRREHASLAPVPLTAAAAGRQRRMKRQSGARHARSLSPSPSQTAGKIRKLCRGRWGGGGRRARPRLGASPGASCPQELVKDRHDGSMTACCSGCRGSPKTFGAFSCLQATICCHRDGSDVRPGARLLLAGSFVPGSCSSGDAGGDPPCAAGARRAVLVLGTSSHRRLPAQRQLPSWTFSSSFPLGWK